MKNLVVDEVDVNSDRSEFEAKARECLNDRRLVRYFEKRLAGRDDVISRLTATRAFDRARSVVTYSAYAAVRAKEQAASAEVEDILEGNAINRRTIPAIILLLLAFFVLVTEINRDDGWLTSPTFVVAGASFFVAGGWLYGAVRPPLWKRWIVSIRITVLGVLTLLFPYLLFDVAWRPWRICVIAVLPGVVGYLIKAPGALGQLLLALRVPILVVRSIKYDFQKDKLRNEWLEDVAEEIIIPHVTFILNTVIEDREKLLVEQHSEGLRRLHDTTLVVDTDSLDRVKTAMEGIDGGSIAVSGPRGVGKSTLLRLICESEDGLVVRVNAPAEYIPREFLAELFQRLCRAFLEYYEQPQLPTVISDLRIKRTALRVIRSGLVVVLRMSISVALLAFVVWTQVVEWKNHFVDAKLAILESIKVFSVEAEKFWIDHPAAAKVFLILAAVSVWPNRRKWRSLRWHVEPQIVTRARENILRLQVERTITLASTVGLPGSMAGVGSLSRQNSVKHFPWSLPELVGNLRRFIEDVASTQKESKNRVVVAIDEIDRIGSVEKAERFISEIKAIFGIENCYFLVSVAEEVGASFGRRALTERTVIETAFDEVVTIEPIDLDTARDLLLKRVPGFTDPFVYLVHALSGGLPRELIRTTRRLVDLNEKLDSVSTTTPRLEELTIALIREEAIAILSATRDQMAKSNTQADLAYAYDLMRMSIHMLRAKPALTLTEARQIFEPLTALCDVSGIGEGEDVPSGDDSLMAKALERASVYAYFSLSVVEVFSNAYFDRAMAADARLENSLSSFEELAAARRELVISPGSCRIAVERFRRKWKMS